MIIRLVLIIAAFMTAAALPGAARAEERITDFDVVIDVEKDGDIRVTEEIAVIAEGAQIRRGIFRDLPRFFEKNGRRLPYDYKVRAVRRNGDREPYAIEKVDNAFRIRIGDADVFLDRGPHQYEIVYEVKNQVRYFDGYDEIYWNATGSYWAFPIESASARINLPDGAAASRRAAYTGRLGASGEDYVYAFRNGAHVFETTKPLNPREGMTVSVGFPKGVVDPPSAADARAEWWTVNASRIVLTLGFLGVGGFYLFAFNKVGRDPPKGPVFAQYEPPEGYSPAATHYIYRRGFSGHDAFIATLMNLATKKRIGINVDKKKRTVIERLPEGDVAGVDPIEYDLEKRFGDVGDRFSFGDKFNSKLTAAYTRFRRKLSRAYGRPYFRWNREFLVIALAMSGFALFAASRVSIEWTAFHTAAIVILAAMSVAASYFLPAPTSKGQDIRTQIEGFRLYLKTAEALQLNAVKVGDDGPPPMTVERYERFLPYAVALGVEKPWTRHFEKLMPKEAAAYQPHWGGSHFSGGNSLNAVNSALVSGLSSGVSSSLPQSSGSSGSGGGGSSGGGGGGGGGGGW